jgi:hypothetical protein
LSAQFNNPQLARDIRAVMMSDSPAHGFVSILSIPLPMQT